MCGMVSSLTLIALISLLLQFLCPLLLCRYCINLLQNKIMMIMTSDDDNDDDFQLRLGIF